MSSTVTLERRDYDALLSAVQQRDDEIAALKTANASTLRKLRLIEQQLSGIDEEHQRQLAQITQQCSEEVEAARKEQEDSATVTQADGEETVKRLMERIGVLEQELAEAVVLRRGFYPSLGIQACERIAADSRPSAIKGKGAAAASSGSKQQESSAGGVAIRSVRAPALGSVLRDGDVI